MSLWSTHRNRLPLSHPSVRPRMFRNITEQFLWAVNNGGLFVCEENKHLPVRDRLAPVHVDKIAHNLLGRKQRLVHNLCFAFLSLRKKNHLVHAKLVKRESCRRSPMWWRLMIRWAGPVVDLIITFPSLHPPTATDRFITTGLRLSQSAQSTNSPLWRDRWLQMEYNWLLELFVSMSWTCNLHLMYSRVLFES